jgi:hypothetical protein
MSGNAGSAALFFDLGSGANARGPANAWASANRVGANGAVSVVAVNGASFYVTGVKLEIGSVATPYNRQSLAKSMADCQRYYQTNYVYGSGAGYVATASWGVAGYLPVAMRASSTIVLGSQANNANLGTINFGLLANQAVYFNGSSPAQGNWTVNMSYTASAEL